MVPAPNQKGFKNHPGVYHYEYKNNVIGMRDTRNLVDYSKYPNKILCLGDSFTYGWGLNDNETFTNILEKKINKDSIAVLNAGASDTGTDYALKFLQVRRETLAPKTVVYFYFDNDMNDNKANAYFYIENDSIIVNEKNSYASINALKKNKLVDNKLYNWLSSHSQLFGLIRHNIGMMWNKRVSDANKVSHTTIDSTAKVKPAIVTEETSSKTLAQENKIIDDPKPTTKLSAEDPLYHTYVYLSAIADETKKKGIDFLVFYIPAHTSLEEHQQSGAIKVEKELNHYCTRNQIRFFSRLQMKS